MKLKNNQKSSKKNISLLLGMIAGFALLAIIALFLIDSEAAETFAWVGFGVTMISSTLLTVDSGTRKPCSPNPATK